MSIRFLYDRQKVAVIYNEKRYTYSDVIKYVKFFASNLEVNENTRIAVMLENRPETVFALFSIWEKKSTSINLDAGYTAEQLAYVFNDSKPEYIFVSNKTRETAEKAKELSRHNIKLIDVDGIRVPDNYIPENETVDVDNLDAGGNTLYFRNNWKSQRCYAYF